jgi:hypothetical protein
MRKQYGRERGCHCAEDGDGDDDRTGEQEFHAGMVSGQGLAVSRVQTQIVALFLAARHGFRTRRKARNACDA